MSLLGVGTFKGIGTKADPKPCYDQDPVPHRACAVCSPQHPYPHKQTTLWLSGPILTDN